MEVVIVVDMHQFGGTSFIQTHRGPLMLKVFCLVVNLSSCVVLTFVLLCCISASRGSLWCSLFSWWRFRCSSSCCCGGWWWWRRSTSQQQQQQLRVQSRLRLRTDTTTNRLDAQSRGGGGATLQRGTINPRDQKQHPTWRSHPMCARENSRVVKAQP